MRIPYKQLVDIMRVIEEVRNATRDRWDRSEDGEILKVIEVTPNWNVHRIGVVFDDDDLPAEEVKKFREEFPLKFGDGEEF